MSIHFLGFEVLQLSKNSLKILENYSDNDQAFLDESIRIFERLISYHQEITGLSELTNWKELVVLCHKSIDHLIEQSYESGYCKFE